MIEKILSKIQEQPKRTLIFVVGFWIIAGLGSTLWHFYTTGTVTVSTNDSTSIIQLTQTSHPTTTKQFSGHFQARLEPGTYSILVSTKTASSRRMITVVARHHSNYAVNLSQPLQSEMALSYGAYSIESSPAQVLFVDMRDNHLYEVVGTSAPHSLSPGVSFQSVKWLSQDFGVGLSTDGHNLYAIKAGVPSQINLPFGVTSHLSYDVSADQSLLVSDGVNVYVTTSGGDFAKIYTATSSSVIQSVAGGSNRVFIGLADKNTDQKANEVSYILTDLRGSVIAKLDHTSIYAHRWSPNGQHLVVVDPGGTIVYDSNLHESARLADKNATGVTWLNDTSLLYGLDDGLYRYDLGATVSDEIVSLGGGRTVTGVSVSRDQQRLFVIAGSPRSSNTQGYSVLKIDLKSFNHPLTARLAVLFPLRLDVCSAQLVNFIKPTIVITPFNPSVIDSCQQTVTADIASIGAQGSGYQISVGSVDVGAD